MYEKSKGKGQLLHKDSPDVFADVKYEVHFEYKGTGGVIKCISHQGYFEIIKEYEPFDIDEIVGKIFYLRDDMFKEEDFEIVVKSYPLNSEGKEFYFENSPEWYKYKY